MARGAVQKGQHQAASTTAAFCAQTVCSAWLLYPATAFFAGSQGAAVLSVCAQCVGVFAVRSGVALTDSILCAGACMYVLPCVYRFLAGQGGWELQTSCLTCASGVHHTGPGVATHDSCTIKSCLWLGPTAVCRNAWDAECLVYVPHDCSSCC